MDVQLFLAHADDQRPVLEEGLPWSAVLDAPAPEPLPPSPQRLANLSGPADALPEQRWALVAPKGPAGDRLLALVAPLRARREEEQGQEALVYRVDPGMPLAAAATWIQKEYRDAVRRREGERPRYLLLLGGADLVSWDLQQMLGGEAFTGRLAFDADRDYEAYVDKALRWEEAPEAPRAPALFHAAQDGSRAMVEGCRHLFQPSLEIARAGKDGGTFDAESILEINGAGGLLREAARARAGMLVTMSHGAGIPRAGWKTPAEQRARQGALVLGRAGELLTADEVARGPFLPGGAWFMFACYGAGTPARSAYFPWLGELHRLGLSEAPDRVLAALPQGGEPPFVAALPKAALANPEGPLGVIGHVDLAWSWSFLDFEVDAAGLAAQSRAERFQGLLQALVQGHRFGVAHRELAHFFRSLSTELTSAYEERAHRAVARLPEDRMHEVRRATLWMQRQDLSAYVLLGDPAARLPIARAPAGIEWPARAALSPALDAEEIERRERAVLAMLRGTETADALAARLGVSRAEVERWAGIFVEAGRAALGRTR